jgi:hypothetical protein
MDLLEVEVCHLEAVGVLRKGGADKSLELEGAVRGRKLPLGGATPADTDLQGPTRGEAATLSWCNGIPASLLTDISIP